MLEFDAIPQYKNLIVAQQAFSGVPKEMIVELKPTAYEHHLLIRLKDDETLQKIPEKKSKRNVVEEIALNVSESSLEFD